MTKPPVIPAPNGSTWPCDRSPDLIDKEKFYKELIDAGLPVWAVFGNGSVEFVRYLKPYEKVKFDIIKARFPLTDPAFIEQEFISAISRKSSHVFSNISGPKPPLGFPIPK